MGRRTSYVDHDGPEAMRLKDIEIEILRLTTQGYRIPEISERLHLAPSTVKGHRASLTKKLGAPTMEAACWTAGASGFFLEE